MKTLTTSVLFWVILGTVVPCLNGGCEEHHDQHHRTSHSLGSVRQGAAAVAVARAALTIVDERPVLPVDRSRHALAADLHADAATVDSSMSSMVLEFNESAVSDKGLPAQLVVGHWASGCPAGERQVRDIRRVLTPLGWKIGHDATDQIRLVVLPQTEICPQLTLYQNGKVLRSWQGYQDPAFLSRELRRAWDAAAAPEQNVMRSGFAGVLHARPQIHRAFVWWRENLGEGAKATFRWDRTGAQTFPLLAKGDWSAEALFGKSGRVEISLVDSKALPINSLGAAYRVLGGDLLMDFDPIFLRGYAREMESAIRGRGTFQNVLSSSREQLVSQIGPVTIWTVVTIVRDLFNLLHPTCDLQLGGNISVTGELTGDTLTLEFQQAPSVKLVALFTFHLSVEQIEITERAVRLKFGGSHLVKERSFEVK